MCERECKVKCERKCGGNTRVIEGKICTVHFKSNGPLMFERKCEGKWERKCESNMTDSKLIPSSVMLQ